MRKVLLILCLGLFSTGIWGQGFHYYLQVEQAEDFLQSRINKVELGWVKNTLVLRGPVLRIDGSKGYSFSQFNTRTNKLDWSYFAQKGSSIATFKLKPELYLHRNEVSRFDLRASWYFINLALNRETLIEIDRYSLSDPIHLNDSTFILCSQQLFSQNFPGYRLDSSRIVFMTYLDEETGSYHFVDSVELPVAPRFGRLAFDKNTQSWSVSQDSLRVYFRHGKLLKVKIDPRLMADGLGIRNPYYLREYRNEYLREGRHRTYVDTMGAKLYHLWYREKDTLEYTLDFEGSITNQERHNIQFLGFLQSLKPREDGVMDWMRYSNNDEIQMYRFGIDGKVRSKELFPKYRYPGYIIHWMWSMPDGSFFLGGAGKRTNSHMQALLIKVDSNGVHDPSLGDLNFELHYNAEQDWLDLFMDDQDLLLWYEVWDMNGILLHEGPAKSFEALKLFKGAKGAHILRLFSFDKQVFYGSRLFIRN